ncbi:MAG: amidase [Chloroflexia bacterium]|nr:amidase [Chloroflexia bacterium]
MRQAGAAFRDGALDPVELTRACLDRIAATDGVLRSWVVVDAEGAISQAENAGRELRRGIDRGPLHGIPAAVKDIIDVAGLPTRCGSSLLSEVAPARDDAPIVARLRAAGAVILGKTVTQEFAAGALSPPARNPWDASRIPGGSSGGSAVAVAVGASLVALGSDTGGSIRIPAAAVGVAGFKPAYGWFDLQGVHPLAPSLDTLGPLGRTVDDVAVAYAVLRDRPLASDDRPSLAGMRLGVPIGYFRDRLQTGLDTVFAEAVRVLRELGATAVEIDWEEAEVARACAFVLNRVETARCLWPHVAGNPDRLGRLNPDLRVRVVGGRLVPAVLYLEALAARERLRDAMLAYLKTHRLAAVVTPTLPATAVSAADPVIRDGDREESVGVGYTRLTMPFNATGQPVLAVPCGFAADGLPVGLQIAGRPGDEATLFAVGMAYERAAGWTRRLPPAVPAEG